MLTSVQLVGNSNPVNVASIEQPSIVEATEVTFGILSVLIVSNLLQPLNKPAIEPFTYTFIFVIEVIGHLKNNPSAPTTLAGITTFLSSVILGHSANV